MSSGVSESRVASVATVRMPRVEIWGRLWLFIIFRALGLVAVELVLDILVGTSRGSEKRYGVFRAILPVAPAIGSPSGFEMQLYVRLDRFSSLAASGWSGASERVQVARVYGAMNSRSRSGSGSNTAPRS